MFTSIKNPFYITVTQKQTMPQARLPDINTAYITYRREALSSMKSKNYVACIGALYALNGLLPKKYRVTISTIEYDKLTQKHLLVTCPKCRKEDIDFTQVKIHKVILPVIDNLISNEEYIKVWYCPNPLCNAENKIQTTRMVQQVLKEPAYFQVVPKPPNRKEGMKDRTTYHNQFINWAETLLIELEAQMAQFRDDNWHKGDEEYFAEDDEGSDEDEDEDEE